jgi:hypothetical protein
MDLAVSAYYAAICGVLGLAAPRVENPWLRFLLGVVVGVAAARIAPVFRGLVGAG